MARAIPRRTRRPDGVPPPLTRRGCRICRGLTTQRDDYMRASRGRRIRRVLAVDVIARCPCQKTRAAEDCDRPVRSFVGSLPDFEPLIIIPHLAAGRLRMVGPVDRELAIHARPRFFAASLDGDPRTVGWAQADLERSRLGLPIYTVKRCTLSFSLLRLQRSVP